TPVVLPHRWSSTALPPSSAQLRSGEVGRMPSVSRAVCVQRPTTSGGGRSREAARSVAAPRARQAKSKAVTHPARGRHCSPPNAVAAPMPATKKVMDIPHALFEEKLEAMKAAKGVDNDTDLTANDLRELVGQYKNVYVEAKGEQFPSDPKRQLQLAVLAVFDSWDSPRANKYRSINQITGLRGTAVNVQCMVFGNMGNTSGTGVLFTRNPSTGEKKLYGEFLVNAQV
uniref:Pyruvate phosphate dikinase AMP/ATP-binding domain-containing protein n=1 Tax=Aegilops tauschii subsp. strangulata TaxID=200361 RepID=A0A452Z2X0_AEGTS